MPRSHWTSPYTGLRVRNYRMFWVWAGWLVLVVAFRGALVGRPTSETLAVAGLLALPWLLFLAAGLCCWVCERGHQLSASAVALPWCVWVVCVAATMYYPRVQFMAFGALTFLVPLVAFALFVDEQP